MANSASQILSNAVASGSFYKVGLGAATGLSPGLEQKIAVMAEANTDRQTEGALDGGILIPTTSKAVAEKFGYGSPAHLTAIRLIDNLSIVSTVEVKYFFVPEAGAGTATINVLTGTGATVTATGTLILNINGELLSIGLVLADTLAEVMVKIKTAINAEINYPVLVSTATPTVDVDIESKWLGQSSVDVNVSVYSNTATGITFAVVETGGTGEVIPTVQLAKFQNDWYPHILNCLGNGAANGILDEFETFVGTPAAGNGKYAPENMTPAIAWTATDEAVLATLTAVTDGQKAYNVNNYVPVPNAQDLPFMNACTALGLFVLKSNGDPKQDVNLDVFQYSTPPVDSDVGDIIEYSFRNSLVKAGCSTVNFKDGSYYLGDMVTTYHPDGETDPIFRYVRDNMIVFNIINQFKAFNDKQKNKSIAPNALPSARITSPALYEAGILNEIIKPYVEQGYIADFDYAKENLDVGINPTNSGRFDVLSPNLITSLLRIVATEVQVNKFYG